VPPIWSANRRRADQHEDQHDEEQHRHHHQRVHPRHRQHRLIRERPPDHPQLDERQRESQPQQAAPAHPLPVQRDVVHRGANGDRRGLGHGGALPRAAPDLRATTAG
jgi:hypothetical protein